MAGTFPGHNPKGEGKVQTTNWSNQAAKAVVVSNRRSHLDTKQKGDVAEQAAILQALKRGWGVLKPVGDRLPYDMAFDISGVLVKAQVKAAWFYAPDNVYITDTRRTQTNRRAMKRNKYGEADFDFALVYVEDYDVFYIFPAKVFNAYASSVSLIESDKRQRPPRSAVYREAWVLISTWAAQRETSVRTPVKVGEASCGGNPEPSPEPRFGEGVET
jgi:hypothetical protein